MTIEESYSANPAPISTRPTAFGQAYYLAEGAKTVDSSLSRYPKPSTEPLRRRT